MCRERAACCRIRPSSFLIFTLALTPPFHHHLTPSRGEGAVTKWRATEVLCPECLKPPDKVLQDARGAFSTLGNVPVFHEYPDPLRPAAVAENADVRELEPSRLNTHERGRASPVMGAAPALAKGTASVKPAGQAEKAMAVKSEALMPWAQDMAGCEVER